LITLFKTLSSPGIIVIDYVDELVQVGGPYISSLMTKLIQTSKLLVIGVTSRMNIIAKQWISTTAPGYVREMTLPDSLNT
jgi:hypothetical protein